MTNRELAETFTLIANLLEIKGETVYKTLAYRRAAESLTALAGDVNQYWKEEKLLETLVSASPSPKDRRADTYRQPSVPPEDRAGGAGGTGGVAPGAGAGSQEGGADLEGAGDHDPGGADRRRAGGQAAEAHGSGGEVRGAILKGIESLARRSGRVPLGRAWPLAQQIISALRKVKGVTAAEPAGSLRRMRSTVGDLDILVAARESEPVMEAFTTLPGVDRVLGKGETKASIELRTGYAPRSGCTRRRGSGQPCSTPPDRRTTTCSFGSLPSTKACRSPSTPCQDHGSGTILCATEGEVNGPWTPVDPARAVGGSG